MPIIEKSHVRLEISESATVLTKFSFLVENLALDYIFSIQMIFALLKQSGNHYYLHRDNQEKDHTKVETKIKTELK